LAIHSAESSGREPTGNDAPTKEQTGAAGHPTIAVTCRGRSPLAKSTGTALVSPVQGVHTVGVGDAFLGGVAVGIMQGEDLRGAAVMGIAAAAASATVPGAGRIDVASVAKLRSEVGVSSANRLDEL
jgi:sugar/nucleoside kinase (ribokinase family)